MDEVNQNYKCHICSINGLNHEEWKDHFANNKEHLKKVEILVKKKYYCNKCECQFEDQRRYDRHTESKKHKEGRLLFEELFCNKCSTQCRNKAELENHIKTKKHLNTNTKKTEEDFFCNKCSTQCHTNSEWDKHIKTKKHIKILI